LFVLPSGGTTPPPLLKNNNKHLLYGNAVENKLGKKEAHHIIWLSSSLWQSSNKR
jgi:hypothetical protein